MILHTVMTNYWWEIEVNCEPALEEITFCRLEQLGCRGTVSEQKGQCYQVRAYLPQHQADPQDFYLLSHAILGDALELGLQPPATRWQLIEEEEWATSWKENWQPMEVGGLFLIYPAWLEPPTEMGDRFLLRLDPGMAFGTGDHPTTQLCLEGLATHYPNPIGKLADIGCGSGILGIGAWLLGASHIYGVDTDPLAVHAARLNRDLNRIPQDQFMIETGSIEQLLEWSCPPFDGICCNILAEVVNGLIPNFQRLCHPHTWAILSGILVGQSQSVMDQLDRHGWVVTDSWIQGEWCCLHARRNLP